MKRILIIILSIALLGGVGWYFYSKNKQSQGGIPSLADFGSFFPIGNDVTPPGLLQGPNETLSTNQNQVVFQSPYRQISPHPVADYTVFKRTTNIIIPPDPKIPKSKPTTQTETHNILRYVARNSGYVYEIEDGGVPLQISNVYIPNIYEAVFSDKFNSVLLRFVRPDQRTIATYSVPIPPANPDGTRTQKIGLYLPDNIETTVSSPDNTQVARLTSDINGAQLSITDHVGSKKIDVIKTSFTDWLISWPNQKTIYLQTKASAKVPGFLYKVDTTEKKLRRVIGNINGLTTSVSPSGTYVLYSQNSGNSFVTKLLNTKTETTNNFNLAILPEKCVWLQNEDLICAGNSSVEEGNYPDDWYMGTIKFSDQLYRIYTATSMFDRLDDVVSTSFDITKLQVNEDLSQLYFIDKSTGLLWQFKY